MKRGSDDLEDCTPQSKRRGKSPTIPESLLAKLAVCRFLGLQDLTKLETMDKEWHEAATLRYRQIKIVNVFAELMTPERYHKNLLEAVGFKAPVAPEINAANGGRQPVAIINQTNAPKDYNNKKQAAELQDRLMKMIYWIEQKCPNVVDLGDQNNSSFAPVILTLMKTHKKSLRIQLLLSKLEVVRSSMFAFFFHDNAFFEFALKQTNSIRVLELCDITDKETSDRKIDTKISSGLTHLTIDNFTRIDVANCVNLISLTITGTTVATEIERQLLLSLSGLPSLIELSTPIGSTSPHVLTTIAKRCPQLRSLSISTSILECIFGAFESGAFKNLRQLTCKFNDYGKMNCPTSVIKHIFDKIFTLEQLRIVGTAVRLPKISLPTNSSSQVGVLRHLTIDDHIAFRSPNALSRFESVEELTLIMSVGTPPVSNDDLSNLLKSVIVRKLDLADFNVHEYFQIDGLMFAGIPLTTVSLSLHAESLDECAIFTNVSEQLRNLCLNMTTLEEILIDYRMYWLVEEYTKNWLKERNVRLAEINHNWTFNVESMPQWM